MFFKRIFMSFFDYLQKSLEKHKKEKRIETC